MRNAIAISQGRYRCQACRAHPSGVSYKYERAMGLLSTVRHFYNIFYCMILAGKPTLLFNHKEL